jgi:hypothetical protein
MVAVTEAIRAGLIPFLAVTGSILAVLVCHVVLLHGGRSIAYHRRQRLIARYRPIVDAALHVADAPPAFSRLTSTPRRHRGVLAALILEPLRVAGGPLVERARAAAGTLGLIGRWTRSLGDRRWWTRAEAAYALGLLHHRPAVASLIDMLDDPYDEVRAAAVEALGLIADPAAIPALIARLPQQSRHQRVRLVNALRQFGSATVAPLLACANGPGGDVVAVAELLGTLGAVQCTDQLLAWCADGRPALRTAALRSLGLIGVDERTYYHVLRALTDEVDEVRAAAAWALGRSGRADAARYLASRLDDAWIVAAQSARALRNLGDAGRRVLEAAAADGRGELARQMLWECGAAGSRA